MSNIFFSMYANFGHLRKKIKLGNWGLTVGGFEMLNTVDEYIGVDCNILFLGNSLIMEI